MLNEATLILLGVLVASAFLVLGVLDLLLPTRRSPPRRAAASRDEPVSTDASERLFSRMTIERPVSDTGMVEIRRPARPANTVALRNGELFPDETSARVKLPKVALAARVDRPTITVPALPPAAVVDRGTAPDAILERCRQLAADGRPGEAVATAMAALPQPDVHPEIASALWHEVALARDRMGDRDGALAAYRSAIEAAPAADRESVRVELAEWAARTARDSVRSARDRERYTALLLARDFLAAAHETVGTPGVLDLERVHLDLEFWPLCEAHVHGLVASRDYAEAYRLATEALADASVPGTMRQTFAEIRTETLAARIDALVTRSLRAVDEARDWEAVGALERAEALLKTDGTPSAGRHDEAIRRVAAAYARLARQRIDAREFEEAVDPLLRVLRLDQTEGESRDAARRSLVGVLDAVVAARAVTIRELATGGSRESAAARADKVSALLRTAIAAGLPQDALTQAIATTRQLLEEVGASPTARRSSA